MQRRVWVSCAHCTVTECVNSCDGTLEQEVCADIWYKNCHVLFSSAVSCEDFVKLMKNGLMNVEHW